ncbi:MAG: dynamin family protein [Deltaproteobacteria bacterium]|nr:dynamin family protein [Deltaproteobacteria bacterium]
MSIETTKARLQSLGAVARGQGYADLAKTADEVLSRLDFEKVHLVVLGEFNRGKSTLVNALIGEAFLPMDIVPTTAVIWAVEQGPTKSAVAVRVDGREQAVPLDQLQRLNADGDLPPEGLRYMRVVIPKVATGSDVVVIDTPGVNDINEQRAEVTYGFLANADAAIFVMDASSPVTKSEAQFLKGQVLDASLDRIVFVLNKTDRLDEGELEDAVASAEERLRELLGKDVHVVAFDAARVLEAVSKGQSEAAAFWGWDRLQAEVNTTLATARATEQRVARAESRAMSIAKSLLARLRARSAAAMMKTDDRSRARATFEQELGADRDRLDRFLEHAVVHGRDRLKAMISVSMQGPADELTRNLEVRLSGMKSDFKTFGERVLPYELQLLVKRWFEVNRPRVEQFLVEFSQFSTAEYAKHFGATFGFRARVDVSPLTDAVANVEVNDPNEYVPLALPAAGYLVAAFLATGPFAIVGLVAGSVVAKVMRDRQATAIRERLQLELPSIVEQATAPSVAALQEGADRWFDGFVDSVRARFDQDVAARRRDFDADATGDGSDVGSDLDGAMQATTEILGLG